MSFISIAGVALLIFATIAIRDASKILQNEIESTLNSIIEQKISLVVSYLKAKESAVKLYSVLPIVNNALNDIKTAFDRGAKSPEYEDVEQKYRPFLTKLSKESNSYNLFLIAPNGDIVFTVLNQSDFATNLVEGSYKDSQLAEAFKMARSLHQTKVTKFAPYAPSGSLFVKGEGKKPEVTTNYSAFMAAPILVNEELIGVIAIQLDSTEHFYLSNDYAGLGQTGEIVLGHLESDSVEIISPLRTNPNAAFNLNYLIGSEYAIPLQKAVLGEDGSGNMRDYEGKPIIAAWRHIPEINWGIVVKIDSDEALERAAILTSKFINAGFILLLGTMFFAFFTANRITKPIKDLLNFTLSVSSGELDRKLAVTSNDEVGQLTKAFNNMLTSRVNYEKELEVTSDTVIKANKELIEANKEAREAVRAKGEFFASMSHEIRTPMNGVLGMLGLLENTVLTTEQRHRLGVAQSSAESLLTLINDILDYSKVDAGKIELEMLNFNLRQMLGELGDSLAQSAQSKGIELILDLVGIEASMVKGDPGRIRQCITNLVSNAIKFTEKGEVVVRVHLTDVSEDQWSMNCAVSDSGIGIPEDKLKFLFDSFSQVDSSTTRRFGGTGLGLSIVKKLAELMGGGVLVTSIEGKGSSFSFDIKLEKSQKSTVVMPEFDISQLKILVVDDNATNREIFKAQLNHWGAEVFEQENGKDTLTHLQGLLDRQQPIYDIAILNMQMPDMDGSDLGQRIRKNPKLDSLKLVMMTSMAHQGDAKHFADIGFSAYFPKPTTTEDLFYALSVVAEDGVALANAEPLVTRRYLNEMQGDLSEDNLIDFTNKRILLVEDNQVNQMVAKGILRKIGCVSIDIAGNGIEALQALQKAPEDAQYDIVLMDCQMPEMDGYEATRQIRNGRGGERNKSISIVAMTANAMQGDKEKCLDAGMDDYLSKPINVNGLKTKLIKNLTVIENLT